MRIAAFQSPLRPPGAVDAALAALRDQVLRCEALGIDLLCCPEGILGGLADYAPDPHAIAIDTPDLAARLEPLASNQVTTIAGLTERGERGRLYNSAVVLHRGSIVGVYRKQHPAINRSVYDAGTTAPVFTVGALTFGIVICRDSTFRDLARTMALGGAAVLFVPTNNGLPHDRAHAELVAAARADSVARAVENRMWVVRADVCGRTPALESRGSTAIVDGDGVILRATQPFESGLIVADLDDGHPSAVLPGAALEGAHVRRDLTRRG